MSHDTSEGDQAPESYGLELESININLLLALDALLSERSVTGAGRMLGLAQSSMSHTLAQLRSLFDDPLLVRSHRGMAPTPRAEQIEAPLRNALKELRKAIQLPSRFDPLEARKRFRVASDEVQQVVLLSRLLQVLHERAPGVSLNTTAPTEARATYLALREGELDFAIGRFDAPPPGIYRETLSTHRLVFVARKGHPRIKGRLTKKRLREEPQLIPTPITGGQIPARFRALQEEQGATPPITSTTPHVLAALLIVSQTDLIMGIIESVARMYENLLDLVVLSSPIPFPAIDSHIIWHERTHHSPAHRWLLQLLRETAT